MNIRNGTISYSDIVRAGCPILREESEAVAENELYSPQFQDVLGKMHEMLERGGVGLAAPQVGICKRVFITIVPEKLERVYLFCSASPLTVWINPTYEVIENDELAGIEKCLSVPGYCGKVMRPKAIRASAFNQEGGSSPRNWWDGMPVFFCTNMTT